VKEQTHNNINMTGSHVYLEGTPNSSCTMTDHEARLMFAV